MLKMKTYSCKICETLPDQISHHKSHLETQKHKDKRQLFEYKMREMSHEERKNVYGYECIQGIIKKYETHIENISESSSNNTSMEQQNNTTDLQVVWRLEQNAETNEQYAFIRAKLQSVIKQCHDILYSTCSIVGTKAQPDIMRILCLVLLKNKFGTDDEELATRIAHAKAKCSLSDKKVGEYISYCKDLRKIGSTEFPMNTWKLLVTKFLMWVFPAIYFEEDAKFNCTDENTVLKLIDTLWQLDITEEFVDAFSTSCGDIHETFRAYGGGKGAKELGQFFTPRHLVHLIFHGLGLKEVVNEFTNPTIYDPCMGTAGFLTRFYKLANISPENIYGCETETDTIKFGEMSLMLTTNSIKNNVVKCDSLCQNPFLLTKKFNAIVTNPPFGTRMQYKDLQKKFEATFPEASVKFSDIYPINMNDGACLFVQHCVYMLEEGGVCAIVLPDGKLFDGNAKTQKEFRKWLCETVNVRTILKVPGGTFEHAGVRTCVVVFSKDGPTKEIQYLQTSKDCQNVLKILKVSITGLAAKSYQLNVVGYNTTLQESYDANEMSLDQICTIKSGNFLTKDMDSQGDVPFYTSSAKNPIGTHSQHSFDDNEYILMTTAGGVENDNDGAHGMGRVYHVAGKTACRSTVKGLFVNNKGVNIRYLYHVLQTKRSFINSQSKFTTNLGVIPIDVIKSLKIPIPTLEIQKQIVEELMKIEESVRTVEKRIEQLKREKEQHRRWGDYQVISTILKLAGTTKMCDVCNVVTGKGNNERSTEKTNIYGIPYYDSNGITSYVTSHSYEGKYVITARKLSIGSIHFVDGKFQSSDNTIVISTKDENVLNINYVHLWLYFNNNLLKIMVRPGPKPGIRKSDVCEMLIPVPPLDVQEQCIKLYEEKKAFINDIEKDIEKQQKHIRDLKQLGKDIIAYYCNN
jgi:restriction endonuclease S subunit/predicted RNA methylase